MEEEFWVLDRINPVFFSRPFSSHVRSERDFSREAPRINFGGVKELDDAIQLFREMKSIRPELSVRAYNKLLCVNVKI